MQSYYDEAVQKGKGIMGTPKSKHERFLCATALVLERRHFCENDSLLMTTIIVCDQSLAKLPSEGHEHPIENLTTLCFADGLLRFLNKTTTRRIESPP